MLTVRRVVIPLRVILVLLFGILVVFQTLSLPGQFAYMAREAPDIAYLRWPLTAVTVFWVLCVQVVIVCAWQLLTLVKDDPERDHDPTHRQHGSTLARYLSIVNRPSVGVPRGKEPDATGSAQGARGRSRCTATPGEHLRSSVRGDFSARPAADAVRHEWLAAVGAYSSRSARRRGNRPVPAEQAPLNCRPELTGDRATG